jgi:thioredoxin 1
MHTLTPSNPLTFREAVTTTDGIVLVDFTAAWCPPCVMIAPVLERIAGDEADRLRVVSLDVDANPVTTSTYKVMGMPTLALFVDGEIVVQFMGAKPRAAILAQLEPHLGHRSAVSTTRS